MGRTTLIGKRTKVNTKGERGERDKYFKDV